MKLLMQAQSGKVAKAQRNKNIKNSVPVCLSACVPNQKGLTLLEMAISMAILAIALVSLANLFPIGLKFSRRASTFSEASILAQRVIENIKRSASIDDGGIPNNSIGYFELTDQNQNAWPFSDDHLVVTGEPFLDANGFRSYLFKYDDTELKAYVKSVDWDANSNGRIGRLAVPADLDDVLLSQKVYVAIYWMEADIERADTFITYISNPFYEKYR